MSRRKSDEVPETEPESKVVVKKLLNDIIGDVVKEREESDKWERLVSTSKLVNDARAASVVDNGPCSDADEEDSDGCFDDRRRLPYDFCTKLAAEYDYSSTTTTSDDDSVVAAAATTQNKIGPIGQNKKSRSTSSSSSAFSRAAYVNRRRKRKRPPMTLEVALAKRRVAVEMLSLKGKGENALPSSASADEIGERQLASPLDLEPSGFVVDEFSPLPEVGNDDDGDGDGDGGDEVMGRGKRLRRANSRYSDDATSV